MKTLELPVIITVGGNKVRVEYHDTLPEGISGDVMCEDRVIRVAKDRHPGKAEVMRTLFHELTHYAFHVTGHSAEWSAREEEPLVYALENMLAPLYALEGPGVKWKKVKWLT